TVVDEIGKIFESTGKQTTDDIDATDTKDFVVTENARNPRKAMGMEFDFECTANYTKKSTAELYFGIEVDGLHEIASSWANYSFDDSRSNKDRVWDLAINATTGNFDYDDGEETGTNSDKIYGKFYLDSNKSNAIGSKYGSTTINSIDFGFYNIDDDDDFPDSERIDFTVSDTTYFDYEMVEYFANKGTYIRLNLKDYPEYGYVSEYACVAPEPTPTTAGTTVTYRIKGYSFNKESTGILGTTQAEINATITYDITYISVNSTKLWNLYNHEVNTLKRVSSVYDSSTWSAYQSAISNAENVLCGGVPQSTIDSAYTTLENAVKALKARVNYSVNGATTGTVTTPQYYTIYSDVSTNASSTAAPLYTFATINLTESSHLAKTGYKCVGWSRTNNSASPFTQVELTNNDLAVANGPTFYAAWSPIKYTVKYNGNVPSGFSLTGSVANQPCTYDTSYTISPNSFIVTNYKFAGWNTNAAGTGKTYQPGENFKNLTATDGATVNLYAIWAPDTVNVKFFINLPSGVSATTSGFKADTTKALTIGSIQNIFTGDYKLTAVGYEHKGWATQASATTATYTVNFTVPNSAQNLYAVWEKKSIKVTYAPNGGTLAESGYTTPADTVRYGETVNLPDADQISRPGYQLMGWNANIPDSSGKNFFIEGTDYTVPDTSGTVVFSAEWTERTTVITFHHNNSDTDVTTTISGKYNSAFEITEFADPEEMEGYTFLGWYIKDGTGYKAYAKPSVFPADDIHLYAGWKMDALSAEIERFPSDIDKTAIYPSTQEEILYYQEPGRTTAKEKFASANTVYGENNGVLYDYAKLASANLITAELKTAIDALLEEPADYSVVDKYRTYYYEMTLSSPDDEYNDSHTYNYNGVDYQVTKEIFTTDSFDAFANAVATVVEGKGIKNQAEVDNYAKLLIEAYGGLTPRGADYSKFDWYIDEALTLNTIVETGDKGLEEFFSDTYGLLWYEEGSWYSFFEIAVSYNYDLPKDLSVLEQTDIDNAVADLQAAYEGMMLNPADYSVYDENGYAGVAESYYNNSKKYQDTYREKLFEIWQEIDNTRGQLSYRYDQATVDLMIENIAELLANPQYKSYEIIFMMNDGTNAEVGRKTLECVASIKGTAPTDHQRNGYVFIGWYTTAEDTEDEKGIKIDFSNDIEMGTEDRVLYARWEKEIVLYTLDVSAINSGIYVKLNDSAETHEGDRYTNEQMLFGTKVTLKAVSDGGEFMYWKDGRNRIVSCLEEIELIIEADWYLTAVYSDASDSGYCNVMFVDSLTKSVIDEQKVLKGASATAPEISETYGEYIFLKWDKSFDCVTGNMIITSVYALSDELFTVKTVIGEETTEQVYRYNEAVTLKIEDGDIPEGKVFAGWSYDGKTIVNSNRIYKFYA
ncbi:MAG: InlB B-repeat-containing protein, partial [Clostridia bacterium]|nr:InlB B-repeat-containing protein [Clostridia bacterium]